VDWNEAERREFLATIDQEADRLTRLVRNLLDMSRIEAEPQQPAAAAVCRAGCRHGARRGGGAAGAAGDLRPGRPGHRGRQAGGDVPAPAAAGLCFGTLALVVGATAGRRSLVLAVTATIGAATYIANSFLAQVDAIAWTRRLSPFHYYEAGQPLRNGVQLGDAGLLLAISLVLLAVGAIAFNRRDIAI
jgi:hypothetical protein